MLIRREISFFFSGLFSTENGRPGGRISDRIERPTVVAYSVIFGTNCRRAFRLVFVVDHFRDPHVDARGQLDFLVLVRTQSLPTRP